MKNVRLLAVLAIGFMSVMSVKAQSQRMMEFQNEFSKYQTQYRDLFFNGKHKEAMAPLASCIAMLDTTTIFKVAPIPEGAIKEQKGLLLYDPMRYWDKRSRRLQHWSSQYNWATEIIIIW